MLTLKEVKSYLKVEFPEDDEFILHLIDSSEKHIENLTDKTFNPLPKPIYQAMLMLIAHWYENREAVLIGRPSKEIEFAVTNLIAPYRKIAIPK